MYIRKLSFSSALFSFLIVLLVLTGCGSSDGYQFTVNNGFADLSAVDFSSESIDLQGSWLLFKDEILTPQEVDSRIKSDDAVPVTVPGLWKLQEFSGTKGSVFGVGTMVITVKLPAGDNPLVFRLPLSQGSSRIFINGQHAYGVLVTNHERSDLVPICNIQNIPLPISVQDVRIVIQKVNWWDSYGSGQMMAPVIGSAKNMEFLKSFNTGYEFFLTGCLLFCALYHLMLFVLERRDKALLMFSLISFGVLLRQISIGEKFLMSMAGIGHFNLVKIEVGSAYLVCALLIMYFCAVFPKTTNKYVRISLVSCAFAGLASVFVPDPRFYSSLMWYLRLVIEATAVYCMYIAVRSIIQKKEQSWAMFLGLCSLAVPTFFDVLVTYFFLIGSYLMPLGFLPFVLIESYLLSRRYTRGTREAENLRIKTERLTDLDRVKTAFIANVAHELRTPITLIQTPIEAIQNGSYGETISKSHPVFSIIISNTKRILKLVESFLMMTRLDSGIELEKNPVDLASLLPKYVEDMNPAAADAGVTLTLCMPPHPHPPIAAAVDMRAFDIIFFNLVTNAIKFTPKGGSVTVSLDVKKNSALDFICLSVADTGIGISEEDLPRLFTRYLKIYDSVRTHYNSNGIGLSLARDSARGMGGDITVVSEAGKGSCFTLTLPLCSEDAGCQTIETSDYLTLFGAIDEVKARSYTNAASLPGGENGTGRKPRILVVEDNQSMRQFVAEILGQKYCVTETCDGLDAKNFLDHQMLPDIIISDIMMPRMDGIELFRYTRTVERLSHIPFIMLTARDEHEDKSAVLTEGAFDYIVKPFSVDDLYARIASVLKRRDDEREQMRKKMDRLIERAFLDEDETQNRSSGAVSGTVHTEFVQQEYPDGLSKREAEVFELVVQGLSDKEIAGMLGISARTASNHVAVILHKSQMSGRGELIVRYGKKLT